MTDINSRLREILGTNEHGDTLINRRIAQIKQAFEEAGYIHFTEVINDPMWMTSQEWYDSFEKELEEVPALSRVRYPAHYAKEAAKRAAGLE